MSSACAAVCFETPDQAVGAVGQEFACDLLAVAEEQGLGHADLRVAARVRERRGERPGACLQGLDPFLESVGRQVRPAGLPGSTVASRSEVASCMGVRGRTRATAKSDGLGASSPSQRELRA